MRNIVLLAFLLSQCLAARAQWDLRHNISNAEKVYALSLFWSEAKYNFAFFDQTDVDWDSAYQDYIPQVLETNNTYDFYRLLSRFCALLKDGHTDVSPPWDIFNSSTYIGVLFEKIGDQVYISNIAREEAERVPIGSELLKINGEDALPFIEREVLPYVSASTEHELWKEALNGAIYALLTDTVQTLTLECQTPAGESIEFETSLKNAPYEWARKRRPWKRVDFELLTGNIGHLMLNTFGEDSVIIDFQALLPELRKCASIIIDLRRNGGGNTGYGAEILKYFTDEDLVGSKWKTREHKSAYYAWGANMEWPEDYDSLSTEDQEWVKEAFETGRRNHWYEGDVMQFENDIEADKIDVPVVVLFGNNTASAAEDFLIFIDGLKREIKTVGQKSFGSTGQPIAFKLPAGAWARICSKRDTYPDGREFVGFGVEPDVLVEITREALISGEDLELEKALEILKNK